MTAKRKLIEVALPLPEINDASAYDKMPGIGPHPKGIHQWWARLPLPVSRAILFASVVDDPSSHPERFSIEEVQELERERLFEIVRRMMQKQLHKHPEIYAEARAEMMKHCGGALPPVLDPFAGGGSIPLEAARLGFETYAGDLNPVCVLLNKCNLELAPRWEERPDLKPYLGKELPVIAWIWARTVRSPNPAALGAHVPLTSTFWLSSRKGSEAWLDPVVDRAARAWDFAVRTSTPKDRATVKAGTKTGRAQFRCLLTGDAIPDEHIKEEGQAGRLGVRLVTIVAEGQRGRAYLSATKDHEAIGGQGEPTWKPEGQVPERLTGGTCAPYGFDQWGDLFTPRQLTALVALSEQVRGVREDARRDAERAGLSGNDAEGYARAVTTFLALALDRCADFNNALCRWSASNQKVM